MEQQRSRFDSSLEQNRAGAVWINVLLGIWVIISPFVLAFPSQKAIWNNVAAGIVIGVLAIIRSFMREQLGWSWINVLLAIWLIVSPFVLGFMSGAALWNNVILGIIIAAIALSNSRSKVGVAV